MDESAKVKRAAKRQVPKKTGDGRTKAVAVDTVVFHQVEAQSKKLNMTKSKFASAALAFFTESGLDPTAERAAGLSGVNATVEVETLRVRTQNMNIGNRLISIIRGWEKNLYTFQQQQQMSTNTYLELIESNVLRHLVALETKLLGPMVEQLFKSNIEAYINRGLAGEVYLKVMGNTSDSVREQDRKLDGERDRELTKRLHEFIKTNTVPTPQPTVKPAITPIPPRLLVDPVPPAPAAPTT